MNRISLPIIILFLGFPWASISSAEETELQRAAVRVAEGLERGTVPAHSYKQSLAIEGLLRWAEASGRKHWRQRAFLLAEQRGLTPDTVVSRSRDPFNCLVWWLYQSSGDEAWLPGFVKQTQNYRKSVVRSAEGAIQHPRGVKRGGGQAMLIDALQDYASRMAMLGVATGDASAFNEAVVQHRIYRRIVLDPKSGLWCQGRGWQEDRRKLSPGHWSRGHGWLIRGMVDSLMLLPPESNQSKELRRYLEELADALLEKQQPNGMWHCLLTRPPEDSPPEVSGTALIAGNIGIALAEGFLAGQNYEAAARRAFDALPNYVRQDGVVKSVSPGPGPLSEEEPWLVESFEPGDPHGPFAILFAAVGDARMRASTPQPPH